MSFYRNRISNFVIKAFMSPKLTIIIETPTLYDFKKFDVRSEHNIQ